MENAYVDIAPRLRALREASDLTPAELARKIGTDEDLVLKYETAECEIPVSYLFKVAQACRTDLTALLSGGDAHLTNYTLNRKGCGLSVERRKDYDYKSLAHMFHGRKMEPFLVTVPSKEKDQLTFSSHPGQEFIYMLHGRLEIHIGEAVEVLEPGDSLYFNSETPHGLRSLEAGNATFLDIIL